MSDITDILYAAHNLRASRETQVLGEDSRTINAIADSYRMLQQSVEAARHLVRSKEGRDVMAELELALSDLAHDSSLFAVAAMAKDAAAEAVVVPIRRPSASTLTVVK